MCYESKTDPCLHGSCSSYLPERVFSDSGYSQIVTGKETEKDTTEEVAKETKPPQVFCTYFHYFKAGPESFDQWWLPGKDHKKILGKESWRRDIWVGRTGDYPYIGIYNNVTDSEIMRWHIRMAKGRRDFGFFWSILMIGRQNALRPIYC